MDRARKVRKILPVSPCDIRGLEAWLEEQANVGLFPVSIGSWAVFTTDGVPGTRFRLEPYDRGRTAPTEEQQELYRRAGWSYALNVAPAGCWLFYTADPAAVELYSDHESRGLSLERLERGDLSSLQGAPFLLEAEEDELIQGFQDAGMQVDILTEEQLQAFKDAVSDVTAELKAQYGEAACAAFGIE